MSTIETGGPAFPNPALADENFHPPFDMSGMTLRDYFAAKAMPVFLANPDSTYSSDAANAYAMADAMLKAREQA